MENNFCKLLQYGRQVIVDKGERYVKPCCSIPGPGIKITENIHAEFYEKYTSVTDWTDMCKVCKQAEDSGSRSERQFHNMLYEEKGYDGNIYTLGFSTKCNAACTICSYHRSSLWAKLRDIPINKAEDDAIEKTLNLFDFSRVSEMRFSGGEPLLDDHHLRVLNQCSNIEEMTIQYTTNGSIYPSAEVLALWRKARTTFISFSVDGTGEKFEYLRWPLSWEKAKANIERFIEEECSNSSPNNIFTCIEVTLNPLNIIYADEIDEWISKYNDYLRVSVNLHPAAGVMALGSATADLRQLVEKKYGADSKITKMLNANPEGDLKETIKFLDWTDSSRKLNWRETFAEIVPYLEKK